MDYKRKDHCDPKIPPKRNHPKKQQVHNVPIDGEENTNKN